MTEALLLSTGKILGSVLLLGLVLLSVTRLAKLVGLPPEVSRKLIHVSLGLYCLTFPLIFSAAWEVAVTCLLACGVFLLARGAMRSKLGEGLHSVNRNSYGEILFAVSVALLFWLKDGHYVTEASGARAPALLLYVLPLLILTLCDAASAVIGSLYGRKTFHVEDGIKSWEGVAVFVQTAWLLSLIALLLLTDMPREDAIVLALITALFGALLEAASWRGLDNLFIPLGIYFLLANLMPRGFEVLVLASLAFASVLIALLVWGHQRQVSRHWLAAAAAIFFCIAIFSGVESILAPLAAVLSYGASLRLMHRERPPHDALGLLVTVLGIALCFFVVSDLLRVDTIFAFNLAFACLAVAIAAHLRVGLLALFGIALGAWALMAVRTLLIPGATTETLTFQAIALIAMVLVAAIARAGEPMVERRPWMSLGGISLIASLAAFMAPTA